MTRARIQEIYETGNDCCEVKGDHTTSRRSRNRPRIFLVSVFDGLKLAVRNKGIYMRMKNSFILSILNYIYRQPKSFIFVNFNLSRTCVNILFTHTHIHICIYI